MNRSDPCAAKDSKSKRIGYLSQGAALSVVDDDSGWLELPTWGINPVMSEKTKDFLNEAQLKKPMYFEATNFTETPPELWGR
jgi:hypothetical protein